MKFKSFYLAINMLFTCTCYAQKIQIFNKKNSYQKYETRPMHIKSRWSKDVTPQNSLIKYPRPQMERKNWENLNGLWEYAITDSTAYPSTFDGQILVPFPIESALSGVQKKLMPDKLLWYRKWISKPTLGNNERLFINFDAVDWLTTIYVNGKKVGQHQGGYQRFSFDITEYLTREKNELLVKVYDPSDKGPNPHGKQSLDPQNIYYTSSSGIWQTVWLEKVPIIHIKSLKVTPNIDNESLNLVVTTNKLLENSILDIAVSSNGKTITTKNKSVNKVRSEKEHSSISMTLSIPKPHLWSPDDPFLYDISIKIMTENKVLDEVKSYFGMRKIDIQKDEKGNDRIFLNNKYTYNLGILDQGFWPEGLYTAPTDEALAFDIKAIKSMGFNTIRKHMKIESDRWYYHADKIGVLVWQDFVNPPHMLPLDSKPIFEKEIQETIDQLYNHPSIITWVLFNERWGAYDQQRLTNWVKNYDASRLINGHSGELLYVNGELREPSSNPWENSDMTDVHSYPEPRNPPGLPGKAKVIGEFGGIGVRVLGHQWDDTEGWGYIQVLPKELKSKYEHMIHTLKKLETEGLSASIYTQPFDVEGEENGLLTYDREIIKIPITEIRAINKILINQTKGFKLDPDFNIASNINTNDNDSMYPEMLDQYKKGRHDSIFLRRITLMAMRKNDSSMLHQIGNAYIGILNHPFSKENLTFISKITKTTQDTGFKIFNEHTEKVNKELGLGYAEYFVRAIIDKGIASPNFSNQPNPNWDSLQRSISNKYGSLGEELILGKRMIYYLRITNDWKNFSKYYVLYYKKALKRTEYRINNITWSVFEHVSDPDVLKFATEVIKYDIETWDQNNPQAYDTYANLLHKLNKSTEAIIWEEKALKLKRNEAEGKTFAETLQKMKSGLPTWPQNN